MHPSDEDWEQEEEESQPMTVHRPNNWVSNVRRFFLKHWQPHELAPPEVDLALHQLTAVERSAEVFRYTLQSLEHWLASSGWLREWIRFNIRLALMIAAPAVLIVPLVTFALGQFNTWAALIATTSTNMLFFPLTALLFVGLISALLYFGNSLRRRPDPRDQHRYY
jgi:hypothetical protein